MDDSISKHSERALQNLANYVLEGKRLLFVTGAGLSVCSGILPYRGAPDAIWNNYLTETGTKSSFLNNPDKWWNEFWLRTHEKSMFFNARPNPGHVAITALSKICSIKVITQNIDKLHQKSGFRNEDLSQIHGELGSYKCSGMKTFCKYNVKEWISNLNLGNFAKKGTSLKKNNLLISPPKCPECGAYLMPATLLFDESYDSHDLYKYDQAREWVLHADVIAFVGTSFSVGITAIILEMALKAKRPLYNFNVGIDSEVHNYSMNHIIGSAVETLPRLFEIVFERQKTTFNNYSRQRLWLTKPLGSPKYEPLLEE
eukprot:TRINITY_DN2656_c0_g2_i1.p1 TRINITY_DN2656_c0_g2~~TRINITY_DN2656_c0_g2_i1.p1  ORF type:complete len:314 (-),score=68.25 TRINITY_DN2656_c0_g2_i1:204-1145(-)